VYASVDDGSLPGLMLTYDTALHGWDAHTGAARWSHDAYLTTGALILRGRVYAATSRGIVAFDGRTGERLWSSEGKDVLVTNALFTDGRHVLVALETGGTATAPVLVAYDPVSGDEAFRAQYPDGISLVGEVDRRLMGYDAANDEYVLLG
jgi:outer membrane protein assembly factor BamB